MRASEKHDPRTPWLVIVALAAIALCLGAFLLGGWLHSLLWRQG